MFGFFHFILNFDLDIGDALQNLREISVQTFIRDLDSQVERNLEYPGLLKILEFSALLVEKKKKGTNEGSRHFVEDIISFFLLFSGSSKENFQEKEKSYLSDLLLFAAISNDQIEFGLTPRVLELGKILSPSWKTWIFFNAWTSSPLSAQTPSALVVGLLMLHRR